jgi:hypothetical protein
MISFSPTPSAYGRAYRLAGGGNVVITLIKCNPAMDQAVLAELSEQYAKLQKLKAELR